MAEEMMPTPNEHGVYCETEWTECIQHTTPSGVGLAVMLVQCDDGWRWGCDYSATWCGGGGYPSIHDTPLTSRQDAVDAACARLLRVFSAPHYHATSDTESRQMVEVRDWCAAQRQLELFA